MSKLARRTDPHTSHEAGLWAEASGLVGRQQAEVLAIVRAYPGRTSNELGSVSEMGRYEIARRLPELERAGKVKRGGARVCKVSGRKALTWSAA